MVTEVKGKIRVLMVDDNRDTLDNLSKMLFFEHDVEIIGTASCGREGVDKTKQLKPDIVLMDINMPDVDGIRATEMIRAEIPDSQVVIMSVQGEQDYLRRAMVAGASDYLTKPFTSEELANSIRIVYEREIKRPASSPTVAQQVQASIPGGSVQGNGKEQGKVVAVFSPKGGVGKTTIASNLAISLKQETGKTVALVDGSLLFGDVGVLLNLTAQRTIVDLVPHITELDAELLDSVMSIHSSGVKVLLSPPRPEMAELVTAESMNLIIAKLRSLFDYVVIDTFSSLQEVVLSVLDAADEIIVIATLELAVLKNIKLFLETTEMLGYQSKSIHMVINRAGSATGIKMSDVESNVNHKVSVTIANDWKLANFAANRGVPFMLSNRESQISKGITDLAKLIVGVTAAKTAATADPASKNRGLVARLNPFAK